MYRLLFFGFITSFFLGSSQTKSSTTFLDVNYFKGNIPIHNVDILHLVQGHPEGVIIGWNHRTNEKKEWEQQMILNAFEQLSKNIAEEKEL